MSRFPLLLSLLVSILSLSTLALNFAWESIQLTDAEASSWASIRFGDTKNPDDPPKTECRYTPIDPEWPTEDEWTRFNETLGGTLLQPAPLAIVCYNGSKYDSAKCEALRRGWSNMSIQYSSLPCLFLLLFRMKYEGREIELMM
jgi:hypothetical protein